MSGNNRFRHRQEKPGERRKEHREAKPNSFLIVSEGSKTEPLYFKGLADYINAKYGDSIDVEKPFLDPQGQGMCTVRLVRETDRIVARAKIEYSQVWVIFDKDDFDDFDEAIKLADKKGYHTGWNNQSFEYWVYLHFNCSDSALHRDGWVEKLSKIYKDRNINPNGYRKNDEDVFSQVITYGSLRLACRNAARIRNSYPSNMVPSKRDPCTTVDLLIQQLEPYIQELLDPQHK